MDTRVRNDFNAKDAKENRKGAQSTTQSKTRWFITKNLCALCETFASFAFQFLVLLARNYLGRAS